MSCNGVHVCIPWCTSFPAVNRYRDFAFDVRILVRSKLNVVLIHRGNLNKAMKMLGGEDLWHSAQIQVAQVQQHCVTLVLCNELEVAPSVLVSGSC